VFTVSNDCPETDLDDPQPKRLKQLTLPFGRPNVSVIRPGKAGSESTTLSMPSCAQVCEHGELKYCCSSIL
jgi:hypothetical protein